MMIAMHSLHIATNTHSMNATFTLLGSIVFG